MRRSVLLSIGIMYFAGVALCATPLYAYSSPGKPAGFVNDFAKVISAETKLSLESELSTFEKSSGNEITVVTISDMGGDYIEHYAPQLFKEWGIGKSKNDNGVLLLLSIKERSLRIEVGYGLEGILPDNVAKRIIESDIVPQLKAGDYNSAVTLGARSIMARVSGENIGETPATDSKVNSSRSSSWFFDSFWLIFFIGIALLQWLGAILSRSKSWWAGGAIGALFGFIIEYFVSSILFTGLITIFFVILGLAFDFVVSRAYRNTKRSGTRPPWWIGGGGIGGGGFGGFGGGSSGGGGASGSW